MKTQSYIAMPMLFAINVISQSPKLDTARAYGRTKGRICFLALSICKEGHRQ